MKTPSHSSFVRFVNDLGAISLRTNAFNQYAARGPAAAANAIRRRNLCLYFEQLREKRPRAILIGEAPSYRGARLTGVPFVSESILLCGIEDIGMFGRHRGYRKTDEWEAISTEASATIVWATIRTVDPLPLLWNAFPFHPYQGSNERTNRMPGVSELLIGQPFITRLLERFEIEQVIAVGNQAAQSLSRSGIPHTKVRHPSQGGKMKFIEGLRAILVDNARSVEV